MTTSIKTWTMASTVFVLLAALCAPGYAFKSVEIGDEVPNRELKPLQGKKTQVMSEKAEIYIILFFRPDHEYSIEALEILTKVCKQHGSRGVHCAAIVSDYYKKAVVQKALRSAGWTPRKTYFDKEDRYFADLGVVTQPVFGIIDKSLRLVASESFVKTNYCARVEARVQFAFGDINEDQLKAALNPPMLDAEQVTNRARVIYNFALQLYKMGKLDVAFQQAYKAVELDSRFADAYGLMGLIYAKQKKCTEARPLIQKAMIIDKSNKNALEASKHCK